MADVDRAVEYLEKHGVQELFQDLTTRLIYAKPEDPRTFLIEELRRLQHERQAGLNNVKTFFEEVDLRALFGTYDKTGTGFITADQYKDMLTRKLGIKSVDTSTIPDKLDADQFVVMAKAVQQQHNKHSAAA